MRKILIISPFNILPPYWGAADRIYNLVRGLSNFYDVSLLYTNYSQLAFNSETDSLNKIKLYPTGPSKRWAQIFNPLLLVKGIQIIKKEKPKYILAEFLWSGWIAAVLSFLLRTPFILDEHNVEWLRFKRMGKPYWAILKVYEKFVCSRAQRICCVSELDKRFLMALGVSEQQVVLVPNGVDTTKFCPSPKNGLKLRLSLGFSKNTPIILFFGKLDYAPNREAVSVICDQIVPAVLKKAPTTKFIIAGSNPPDTTKHNAILFTGVVKNIEDYIRASDVVIVPLFKGGGTRLKILQAICCGKPVISTSLGAEGLPRSRNITRVDTLPEFVYHTLQALKTKKECNTSEERVVHSWLAIVERMVAEL